MKDGTSAASGVDYANLDGYKALATEAGEMTAGNLRRYGFREVAGCRGTSAYEIESLSNWVGPIAFGATPEGLGTKCKVAQKMQDLTGNARWWYGIGQDAVAMIVNDLITRKIPPMFVTQHLAVGDGKWFQDEARSRAFIDGWAGACNLAGCTWGSGETPELQDIVYPDTVEISGAGFGIRFWGELKDNDVVAGDAIVIFLSNGIHSNGLTLARQIGDIVGYLTEIPGTGTMYGEALLKPTHIYTLPIVEALERRFDIHGMVNITGHGWKKLMRPERELTYRITKIPDVSHWPEFQFIQDHDSKPKTLTQRYASLNMGGGFAVYLPADQAKQLMVIAANHGIAAYVAGQVEEGPRRVILEPIDVTYDELWAA